MGYSGWLPQKSRMIQQCHGHKRYSLHTCCLSVNLYCDEHPLCKACIFVVHVGVVSVPEQLHLLYRHAITLSCKHALEAEIIQLLMCTNLRAIHEVFYDRFGRRARSLDAHCDSEHFVFHLLICLARSINGARNLTANLIHGVALVDCSILSSSVLPTKSINKSVFPTIILWRG